MKIYDISHHLRQDAVSEPAVLDIAFTACWTDYAHRQDLHASDPAAVLLLAGAWLDDADMLTPQERDYCSARAQADAEAAYQDREVVSKYAMATAVVHIIMRKYYYKVLTSPQDILPRFADRRCRAQECARRLYGQELDFTTVPVRGNPTMSSVHACFEKQPKLSPEILKCFH